MNTTFRRSLTAVAVAAGLSLLAPSALALDDTRGQLKGHVETSGSNLANATITVTHEGKGITRSVRSNDRGEFVLKGLPAGKYTIVIAKDGFERFERKSYTIKAGSGNAVAIEMFPEDSTERIEITAGRIAMIDTSTNTQSLDISSEEINVLPVNRDINAISLLAPGTMKGDPEFGDTASFGGASVGENGYYLNGINITEFRNGNGPITIPWELVNQTSTLTSGVGSEYGRHIGGVVNLTSKSGDNEFRFGARVDYIPESMYSNSPDIIGLSPGENGRPIVVENNREDQINRRDVSLWASGPIIEDRLFFYALYNPINRDNDFANPTSNEEWTSNYLGREYDSDFWFGKIDFYLTDDHSFEFQAMNNETTRETTTIPYSYLAPRGNGRFGTPNESKNIRETGGDLWSVSYNGIITDDITVTARYGKIKQDDIFRPGTPDRYSTFDERFGGSNRVGNTSGNSTSIGKDEKTVWRIDVDWIIGDHTLRFGYDSDELEADQSRLPNGTGTDDIFGVGNDRGVYTIITAGDNDPNGFSEGETYVERRIFSQFGVSEMNANAYYIQDSWQVTDDVTLNLGARWSSFENTTTAGEVYVKQDDQFAPRLGATWDVFGDGESKATIFFGRFFMGVAPNSNVRLGGAEADYYEYYDFVDVDQATGLLTLGDLRSTDTIQSGEVAPGNTLASTNLDAMYSDEISVSWEQQFNDDWSGGVRVIRRELESSIEDAAIDINRDSFGVETAGHITGIPYFFINPGSEVTLLVDDGNGGLEERTFTPEELGFPQSERKYTSVEFTFKGNVNSKLQLQGSYTWSQSEGNTEGMMRSDNGQDDAGLTTSFDFPGLVDHGYGMLPNDRKHNIKLFGSYALTDDITLGFNLWAMSGRPVNRFGIHPTGAGSCVEGGADELCISRFYGNESFYTAGEAQPRGSHGRTPWVWGLDLSASYIMDLGEFGEVDFKVSVENILDLEKPLTLDEIGETNGGVINPNWRGPKDYQTPRNFMFTASYKF